MVRSIRSLNSLWQVSSGWHTALDLENLLVVSEAVARAGIARTESRGAHFREDFPEKSDEMAGFNSVVKRGDDGEMTWRPDPLRSRIQQR